MTWFSSEDLARALARGEELEKDYEGSVLASRPTGRPLKELVAAHESRLRWLLAAAFAFNVLSIIAFVGVATGMGGALLAAGFLLGGLGAIASAALQSRKFEKRIREIGENRTPRKAVA